MLIPFRSKVTADFFMFEQHVRALFELMGKPYTAQGVMTGLEAGRFAQALSVHLNALPPASDTSSVNPDDAGSAQDSAQAVGLKQRAWPLIDMLTRASSKNVDVVWGLPI